MADSFKILLVDDHALVRDMLKRHLDAEADLEVVAVAGDMTEAIEKVEGQPLDVAVLDIEMPGLSAFDGAQRLRATHPLLRLMFLSGSHRDSYVQRALEIGADGYASKAEPLPALILAIRAVAQGESYFSPQIRDRMVIARPQAEPADSFHTRLQSLTRRELEVLGYLARGLAKKEIATLTNTSVKTIEQHCANIMLKLDIHDRVMLARYAIREGLVKP